MSVIGEDAILYLSQADVTAAGLSMLEIIDALEDAFREKAGGRVEMPPKPGIHPGGADNFIHAMPASIPRLGAVGMKWVSGYPGNVARGLPYISGLLILNDPDTGLPTAVMDCVWITAMRTAGASALSARYLARKDSSRLGVLGCGVQGHSHLDALTVELPGLRELRAYDVDPRRAERLADAARERFGLEAVVVGTPREAVEGSSVVVTAGPILHTPHATIRAGWLGEGVFVSAVDFDSYFHPDAFDEIDRFTTDDVPQLHHFRDMGYFQHTPAIHAELGELVTGQKAGRESEMERTMACNLGLALDDMAIAPLVLKRAIERGLGTRLPR